jgi:hypothetical protein
MGNEKKFLSFFQEKGQCLICGPFPSKRGLFFLLKKPLWFKKPQAFSAEKNEDHA